MIYLVTHKEGTTDRSLLYVLRFETGLELYVIEYLIHDHNHNILNTTTAITLSDKHYKNWMDVPHDLVTTHRIKLKSIEQADQLIKEYAKPTPIPTEIIRYVRLDNLLKLL